MIRIKTLKQALEVGALLRRLYVYCHAALMLDNAGRVAQIAVFTSRHDTVDDAIEWALVAGAKDGRATRLLLISIDRQQANSMSSKTARKLDEIQRSFSSSGVEAVDWIIGDNKGNSSSALVVRGPW